MDLTGPFATFDIMVAAILLISGLLGFMRGATRDVVAVLALIAGAFAAVFGYRYTGPVAHHLVRTGWIATAAALLMVFVFVFTTIHLVGGSLVTGVRATPLSAIDRGLGFGLGLIRGVLIVGVFVLFAHVLTPVQRNPPWLVHAKLYPLANGAGQALLAAAPEGLRMARAFAPTLKDAVADRPQTAPAAGPATRTRHHGYTPAQRRALDDLVEKSR